MKKKSKSSNVDFEERFEFGPYKQYLTIAEIARIYKWRRKFLLSTGACVHCNVFLKKKDKLVCGNCNYDMKEFCFEPTLRDRDKVIKEALSNINFYKGT
jgi:ribosomal protein S27AE